MVLKNKIDNVSYIYIYIYIAVHSLATGPVWFTLRFLVHTIQEKNLACMEC